MCLFRPTHDGTHTQGISLRTGKTHTVMVRLYNDADRRITSQYEFILVYSNIDIPASFTAMRTVQR